MGILWGIIYHTIGGIASGSFYMPFKKVKGWSWESYWIIGGIFSWLIVPPLAAFLTIPDFFEIIQNTSSSIIGWTIFFGILWGIGGLTYGLGVRYLGMSLGNSVILGFCSAFGSLLPSIYYNFNPTAGKTTFTELLATNGGRLVILGVIICLIGIYFCGKAGMMKEKDLTSDAKKENIEEFNISKGLIIAVISGILSACFNFGIEAGTPMAEVAVSKGINPLFQNNVIYVVLLWGGLTTNLLWCLMLNFKNKSFGDYTNSEKPLFKNYLFSALAGTTWFLQFFFYGMGESRLGNGASSWILHMATIIITANLWGIYFNEWKNVSKKTWQTIILGVSIVMLSVVVVGIGNSIK